MRPNIVSWRQKKENAKGFNSNFCVMNKALVKIIETY